MTYSEFKTWYQGFSAGVVNPTPEQLEIVKKKLAEVSIDQLPTNWTSTNTWENLNKDNKSLLHD